MIKNKFFSFLFFSLLVILIGGVFGVDLNQAKAVGDAYFPEDTTFSTDATDVIITGGSQADTVETTNTAITITISAGQSLTIKSTSRKLLNVNGYYTSKTCIPSESTVVITPPTGSETTTITPQSTNCVDTNSGAGVGSGSSGGGGGGTTTSAPTPTPVSTVSPTVSPVASPSVISAPVSIQKLLPASIGFVSLAKLNLKDGDIISAAGSSDPDVYIVNPHGYKRLFLNPAIFNFYGHLGGFAKVKKAASTTRDTFVTSGLFRNCETNDKKVYGVETTGEDTGMLHWINTTGDQAVKDDPDFFKKVFCINTRELNWYKQGAAYTSVNQIPDYTRKNISSVSVSASTPALVTVKKYKVFDTPTLNIRISASTASAILGKLLDGQIIESLGISGLWHKIKYQNKDGWVHGDYLKAI